jgi:hypothetical protein
VVLEGKQLFGASAEAHLIGWHTAFYGEERVTDGSLSYGPSAISAIDNLRFDCPPAHGMFNSREFKEFNCAASGSLEGDRVKRNCRCRINLFVNTEKRSDFLNLYFNCGCVPIESIRFERRGCAFCFTYAYNATF